EKELLGNQSSVEQEALQLYNVKNPKKTADYLTKYTENCCLRAVEAAWKLGDDIWTHYDELW
ncbi:MAG: peptidase C69, partial [Clostridia bacterium]|nr:peptidase C69 [Clostridia bacterium]